MKLQSFTSNDDGQRITRVSFAVADHSDLAKRTEWIDVQIGIDVSVVRNGALLRAEVLRQVRDKLDALAADYARLPGHSHLAT